MALLLGPKPFDSSAPGWSGFEGPAIEVYYTFSETSGKFNAAETMARVFPAYRAWARSVLQELDQPIPFGPYPTDTLTDRSESVVEYKTPAQTEGLGTHSTWLRKSDLPIAGAAILIKDSPGIGDAPDVLLLAIRLPAELASLTPLIVRNAEHDTRDAQSSPR